MSVEITPLNIDPVEKHTRPAITFRPPTEYPIDLRFRSNHSRILFTAPPHQIVHLKHHHHQKP